MFKNLTKVFVFLALPVIFLYANVLDAQIVTNGLVSYWSLDKETIKGDTVQDLIGVNHGTMKDGPTMVNGKIAGALKFNGSSFVDIPGTDSLNFNGKTEMSVMAWANAESDDPVKGVVTGCCGSIVAQRDANSWALRYDGRNGGAEMEFIICPNWQGDNGFGTPKIKKGEWHHLMAVVNKDKVFLYLDGALVKEGAFAGPIASAGSETEIGKAQDGGFIGMIDEVGIYKRALSADEVKKNFQAKDPITCVNSGGKLTVCWGDLKK